jgi:anti-anti-sigma factor
VRFRLGPPDGPGAPLTAAPPEQGELGPSVAEVRGELDLASVDTVRADLLARLAALPAGARFTLDLRPTTYLPSAGIGLLLELMEAARARGVDLRVVTDPAGLAARAFALAGLQDVVTGRIQ